MIQAVNEDRIDLPFLMVRADRLQGQQLTLAEAAADLG
jgi:hypothetical protein